ncbi:DUF397 domain-containing protein [Streptomyces sp. G-5]|uniref:DUF397 domain-containing protein n=1 Tax=Streptomyces sp. G-5 TaxID=2977231 RepID=UPI0021D2FE74|nr:DUF397 domain-containing protein [Streptomyces sp. G-5]MCU4748259.1 DUF397 domain-containing protein [Streptomyces sp. G-5]
MSDLLWQKSSYSSGDPNQNCIEAARSAEGRLYLRESNDPSVVLITNSTRLVALLRLARK